MAQVNELTNYEDIKLALTGALREPFRREISPELRNRLNNAYMIERTQWVNYDYSMINCESRTLRELCARAGMEEELHQAILGSLSDPSSSPWDLLVKGELGYIDLLAQMAQIEPDNDMKTAINYLLLDHVTHVKQIVEVSRRFGLNEHLEEEMLAFPKGRPLDCQFIATADLLKEPYKENADPATKVNVRILKAMEISMRELLQLILMASPSDEFRLLARQLSVVDSQHLTMVNSFFSTSESMIEKIFFDELAEVNSLNRLFMPEHDEVAEEIYGFIIGEDENHLKSIGILLFDLTGKDPSVLSESKALVSAPKKKTINYIRQAVSSQMDVVLTGKTFKYAA